jgi:hypothetical protein
LEFDLKYLEPAVQNQRRELEKLQTVLPKLQQSADTMSSLVLDKDNVKSMVMQTEFQVALDKLLRYESKAKACQDCMIAIRENADDLPLS